MTDNVVSAHIAVVSRLLTGTSDVDLTSILHSVAASADRIADGAGAAVVVGDVGADPERSGSVGVVATHASHTSEPDIEIFIGAARESMAGDAVVILDDTSETSPRWAALAEVASAGGVGGLRAFPIRISSAVVGALVVCTRDAWTTTMVDYARRDAMALQVLADLTGAAILLSRDLDRGATWSRVLRELITVTAVKQQAAGVVAESNGITIEAATAIVLDVARTTGESVAAIARRVIAGDFIGFPDVLHSEPDEA